MAYRSFEELDVWKRSCNLAVRVYQVLRQCKDYGLRNQMQRASVSIPSNIAEGAERTRKEFAHFLLIARGSAAELRTQTYIAAKLGVIDAPTMREIADETKEIAKMLFALRRSLRTKPTDIDSET